MPLPNGNILPNSGAPAPALPAPRGNRPSEILFGGGLDAVLLPLPSTNAFRDGIQTFDATPGQVLNSVTPANGQQVRVLSEVMAVRTDVVGDAAWFLLRGVWLRNGGSLVVVKAPSMVDSGSTAGASTWTAVLAASDASVQTQVMGQAGKTVHWSVVREWIEAS